MNARTNRGWVATTVAAISTILAAASAAPAQTLTTLVNFDVTNGSDPLYASPDTNCAIVARFSM